ncbi:MAG: hypothetical protein ACK47R_01130, partial [Planctomycetia bacterium]
MANIISQSWLIDRRHALRAMGSCVALPMLDCMVPAFAAEPATPRRSAFIYIPNGVNTLDYQITTQGREYQLSKTLSPLEKH